MIYLFVAEKSVLHTNILVIFQQQFRFRFDDRLRSPDVKLIG